MLYFFAVIDWRSVWTNGLWILGTAVLLGTFSYVYWLGQTSAQSRSDIYQKPPYAQLFWIGFLLILLGLIFTSARWWETAVWLLFTIWALFNLVASLRSAK
ncbi:MAG: hypothetical protein WAS33_19440 [Candidatus Promineifilaceae bacterium]|nr:hypothetical protein [Anaerolineaceae bacterium]